MELLHILLENWWLCLLIAICYSIAATYIRDIVCSFLDNRRSNRVIRMSEIAKSIRDEFKDREHYIDPITADLMTMNIMNNITKLVIEDNPNIELDD